MWGVGCQKRQQCTGVGSREKVPVEEEKIRFFTAILIQENQDFAMLVEDFEPIVSVLLRDVEPVGQSDESRIR
jgi:hypothetical protein